VKQETSPEICSQNASAVDALQETRGMPPGGQRTGALKKAGLLRRVADSQGLIFEFKESVSCPRSVRPAQSPTREPLIVLFR
jgi:hypothetical protein